MAEAPRRLSEDFRDFLVEAKQHGYGNDITVPEETSSGSWRLTYSSGPWQYVDSWEGGSPMGGHEHVSYEVEGSYVPVWQMSYRETSENHDAISGEDLRSTLGKVLSQPDPDLPIRGPKFWQEAEIRYRLQPVHRNCAIEDFDAEEFIFNGKGPAVYVARFMGGLVNRNVLLEASNPPWLEPKTGD